MNMTKIYEPLIKYYDVEELIDEITMSPKFKFTSKYDGSEYYFTINASEMHDFIEDETVSENISNMLSVIRSGIRNVKIDQII